MDGILENGKKEVRFFIVFRFNFLDGIVVTGVFKDWHKAMSKVGEDPIHTRMKTVVTFEENM